MSANLPSDTAGELTCQELVGLVTEYLENTLSAVQRVRFEAHLGVCPGCTIYVEQLRTTIVFVGRLTEDSLSPEARQALTTAFRRWKSDPR